MAKPRDPPPSMKKIGQAHDRQYDYCWRCGKEDGLIKAHIVAHSHGGSNDPDNYIILCVLCHEEQPDGASREVQLAWAAVGESHITIMLRLYNQMREAMNMLAKGDTEKVIKYIDEVGELDQEEKLSRIYRLEAAGPKNKRANIVWSPIEDFYQWLQEQEKA